MDTEKLLYHGTSHDVCNNISRNGFDRGYCGKNGSYDSRVFEELDNEI